MAFQMSPKATEKRKKLGLYRLAQRCSSNGMGRRISCVYLSTVQVVAYISINSKLTLTTEKNLCIFGIIHFLTSNK